MRQTVLSSVCSPHTLFDPSLPPANPLHRLTCFNRSPRVHQDAPGHFGLPDCRPTVLNGRGCFLTARKPKGLQSSLELHKTPGELQVSVSIGIEEGGGRWWCPAPLLLLWKVAFSLHKSLSQAAEDIATLLRSTFGLHGLCCFLSAHEQARKNHRLLHPVYA